MNKRRNTQKGGIIANKGTDKLTDKRADKRPKEKSRQISNDKTETMKESTYYCRFELLLRPP